MLSYFIWLSTTHEMLM